MFFGLTNLLAMFQAMINELLKDFINTGKVESFIIVRIESEKEYDELVKEILRK